MPVPYVQIRLLNPKSADFSRLGEEATRLMAAVMRKRPDVTVVEIVETSGVWYAGGKPVTGSAAYADIKITQATNSVSDKSRLLAEFQAMLEHELGGLCAPAYVVVHELPATDWGYDGLSQASRQAKGFLF